MNNRITSSPEDYLKVAKEKGFYPFAEKNWIGEVIVWSDITDKYFRDLGRKIVEADAFYNSVSGYVFSGDKLRAFNSKNMEALSPVAQDAKMIYLDLVCEYGALLLRKAELYDNVDNDCDGS